MKSPAPMLDWRPVAETLTALHAEYGKSDELIDQLFAELEKRRAELTQRAIDLERHRQEADHRRRELEQERDENRRLVEQFEQQERRLTEALGLLEQVKHGLDESPACTVTGEGASSLQAALDQLTAECESLRKDRDARLAELEAARAAAPQWTQLAAEIERLGATVQERLGGAAPAAERSGDADRVAELEKERAALVAELEQVRDRAAELHESLLEQQRDRAQQQSQLAGEVQSLRELVERQAELLASLSQGAAPVAADVQPTLTVPHSEASAPSADPVVSSVMAQFAQLQRDVAKRRKRK